MNKSCKVNSGGWGSVALRSFSCLSISSSDDFPFPPTSYHHKSITTPWYCALCTQKTDLVEILSPRSWNSGDIPHPPYLNYFLDTMCGCKSCDGIQDEHKTLCNQRQSHCIRRRMAKSTATELALSLDRTRFVSCFQLRLWRRNGNEKFSPRFALGRWQSAACWEATFRH